MIAWRTTLNGTIGWSAMDTLLSSMWVNGTREMLLQAWNHGWEIQSISILFSGRIAERSTTLITLIPVVNARLAGTGEVTPRTFWPYSLCRRLVTPLSEVMSQLSCKSSQTTWAQLWAFSVIQGMIRIVKLLKRCAPLWTLATQKDIA